ncbi:MAG: YdcF family protein [Desulfarculaceae bacterium]|nr:YdcF family protein [Desulfarculaceae bacterium]MCF8073966.1 YdcF family protein [Desulfarculaceae bacterium]MCF8102652.1 YdcF family protein [Desulfarculaceae bacterium]MCF8116107.1 YdcF family protein [Desulfarculaceae bacterium]
MTVFAFIVKKVLSRMLFPVGQVLLLWLAGALIWWRRPSRKLGPLLMLGAGLWLVVLSLPVTGSWLIHRLELRNYQYADPADLVHQGVREVVVLSGGMHHGDISQSDRLSQGSLKRLLEGVRLWKQMPGAKLVLTGGSFVGGMSEGEAMAELARSLGVPPRSMVLETGSWDTDDQARRLRNLLGMRPFALVTSATHMPRSLAIFRAFGMDPMPAPADFRTKGTKLSFYSFMPQAGGLQGSEAAFYEFLGLAWLRLKQALGATPQGEKP